MKKISLDVPKLVNATNLMNNAERCRAYIPDGKKWIPMRGVPFWGLCPVKRIKLAWLVFTGKADALVWEA